MNKIFSSNICTTIHPTVGVWVSTLIQAFLITAPGVQGGTEQFNLHFNSPILPLPLVEHEFCGQMKEDSGGSANAARPPCSSWAFGIGSIHVQPDPKFLLFPFGHKYFLVPSQRNNWEGKSYPHGSEIKIPCPMEPSATAPLRL